MKHYPLFEENIFWVQLKSYISITREEYEFINTNVIPKILNLNPKLALNHASSYLCKLNRGVALSTLGDQWHLEGLSIITLGLKLEYTIKVSLKILYVILTECVVHGIRYSTQGSFFC